MCSVDKIGIGLRLCLHVCEVCVRGVRMWARFFRFVYNEVNQTRRDNDGNLLALDMVIEENKIVQKRFPDHGPL